MPVINPPTPADIDSEIGALSGDLAGTLPSPTFATSILAPAPTGTDRAALQSILDTLAGNGELVLRPGTYTLDATGPLSIARSGTQDVQTITTTGVPTGGSFTLSFGGQTTSALNHNSTAASIQTALNALTSIFAVGGVQCSGGALPTGVVVRFNQLGARALMTHADSLTGGTSPVVAIAHTTTGTGAFSNFLRIRGNGSEIKLTASAPRAFDLTRTADYDVHQNIEITDLTINAQSVAQSSNQHVVLGNLIGGSWTLRPNVQNVAVRRVSTINVPAGPNDGDTVGSRQNVSIVSRHSGSSEATQTFIQNVLVEDCNFQGGGCGVVMMGSEPGNTANVFIDNIKVHRLTHNTGVTPTQTAIHAGIQIGGSGFGGRCLVQSCDLSNPADVGIEIDGMTDALVVDTRVVDAWNEAYLGRNFNTPQYPNAQRIVYRNCEARVVNLTHSTSAAAGWAVSNAGAPSPTFGTTIIEGCKFHSRSATWNSSSGIAIEGLSTPWSRLIVRNFAAVVDNVADASSGGNPRAIRLQSSVSNDVTFDNVRVKLAGTTTNTGGSPQWVFVAASASTTCVANLNGLVYDVTLSGWTAGNTRLLRLGDGSTTGTLAGSVRRMVILAGSGDANMKSISIRSSSSGNILRAPLLIEDCDFTQNPGGFDVTDWDATQRALVKLVGNRFKLSTAYDVASAATIAVWTGQWVNVTGTTNVTSITAGPVGEDIKLRFAGALTLTDGSNLKLDGNFVTAADSTWTGVSDGTNWIETGRSTN